MRWFGESWGAPVCDPADHVPTPVGMNCLACPEVIREDDRGFITFYAVNRDEVVWAYYHRDCLLTAILGPSEYWVS